MYCFVLGFTRKMITNDKFIGHLMSFLSFYCIKLLTKQHKTVNLPSRINLVSKTINIDMK